MNTQLSPQDLQILELLQQDASMTTQDIAERIHMSQSPCWRRISRLEEQGLIQRKVAVLNREQLGIDMVAFTTVNLSSQGRQNLQEFEDAVAQFRDCN